MNDFNPTRAPAGRLLRLGVVVNTAESDGERIALLCDRAGIGCVWLADVLNDIPFSTDPWVAARRIRPRLQVARLGIMSGRAPGEALAGIELSVTGRSADQSPDSRVTNRSGWGRVSVVLDELTQLAAWLGIVDEVCLPAWNFPDLETAADEVRAESVEGGRDAATLGVSALLPVSIGRTEGEASARADGDELFRTLGHPRDIGVFGTLEECQDRVVALAHAGITDLRAILPATPDVHDVIAQLTAMTIGTTEVLTPGALRSPAPPPPEGWGGRPEIPPAPRVSGGSRRR